ncbi:tdp-glycosamine n-acetyltransferase [Anopheles sinensis]|uniref:Tdp-glycosamine n-acetyltransferase n=1 Tax=Anopheles sinensis TaxID=74873 RepID=A0A084WNT7_ANOSI|nr:tdp-glycosamine n-acetyltransferase [Anopheles sinensis]
MPLVDSIRRVPRTFAAAPFITYSRARNTPLGCALEDTPPEIWLVHARERSAGYLPVSHTACVPAVAIRGWAPGAHSDGCGFCISRVQVIEIECVPQLRSVLGHGIGWQVTSKCC